MDPSLIGMVQAGGVIAFAAAVWFELREQRKERRIEAQETREILGEMRDTIVTLAAIAGIEQRRRITTPHGNPIIGG